MEAFLTAVFVQFFGNIASVVIVAVFLGFLFRVPSFELRIYTRTNSNKDGSIFFDLKNKKLLMSYNADDVYYKIYIPERLFTESSYSFKISTVKGWDDWNPLYNFKDKDRFQIDGGTYIMINGKCGLNIFPEQSITLFRINGNFQKKEGTYKIYYQFRTRYGFIPNFVRVGFRDLLIKKFSGRHTDVLKGRLPHSILNVS